MTAEQMKQCLLDREAKLAETLTQLDEQHQWAQDHGYYDLRDAYTEGQRLLLDRIRQIQTTLNLLKSET